MAFQVSPGVNVSEIDLTGAVVAASTSIGGTVMPARWGPANTVQTIATEEEMLLTFGKPNTSVATYWFSAASFLNYGNNLKVTRTVNSTAMNASSGTTEVLIKNQDVYNDTYNTDFGGTESASYGYWVARYAGDLGDSLKVSLCSATRDRLTLTGTATYSQSSPNVTLTGVGSKFKEELHMGDVVSLSVSAAVKLMVLSVASDTVCTLAGGTAAIASSTVTRLKHSPMSEPAANMLGTAAVTALSKTITGTSTQFDRQVVAGDIVTINGEARRVASVTNSTQLVVNTGFNMAATAQTYSRTWEGAGGFIAPPTTSAFAAQRSCRYDEVHVAVIDEDGNWTGNQGEVLETFPHCSVASDHKGDNGESRYYKNVILSQSRFVYWLDHPSLNSTDTAGSSSVVAGAAAVNPANTLAWGAQANTSITNITVTTGSILEPAAHFFTPPAGISTASLDGGIDGTTVTNGEIQLSWDLFKSPEDEDVNLLITGPANVTNAKYVIQAIAENRKDAIAFVSPQQADVVGTSGQSAQTINVVDYFETFPSTSYAVADSGWKYMYDKYNDVFRWIPLNGDIAGMCAKTDADRATWFSPGGFTRGQVQSVVRLAFNPRQVDRDELYQSRINPVVTFPGEGTVLFGDKTLLSKPSAFDRINVRRLFIFLEKAIANAAKFQLFEFNDAFTRSQFVGIVEPFLRDVQGGGGIQDFKVVCDDSNNTASVIDRNEFRGDIFIKPSRSINFIQLNFVAVRSGASFSEVTGAI